MIKKSLLSLLFIAVFALPATMWLFGGEPFPRSSAAVSSDTRFVTVRYERQSSLPNTLPAAPAVTVVTPKGAAELPGPCYGVAACEGKAETALPGAEWQTYVTLESLLRDFEDACHHPIPSVRRRETGDIVSQAKRYAAPYLVTVCQQADLDPDYRRVFCEAWSC